MYHCRLISGHIFVLLLLSTRYVGAQISDDLVVETKVGHIRGLRADDGNYTMFMGIPYAKVNESNIFGSSIPHEPFEGVFEAYDDSAICPQIEEFNLTIVGTLDCLHLNVYVPDSASSQNPLPVMVYIYGGKLSFGFAGRFLYGPKYLVRHDVILVTLNYRVGPYGFMCLNTPEVPGNAGLKDQVTALRWVRNNIESFGGDPKKITLFGNSAGGISIHMHLISDTEKLFTNVIIQSGTVFHPGLVTSSNTNVLLAIAKKLGLTTDDVNEAISFISTSDVHSVIEASPRKKFWFICLEKEFPGEERFLSKTAINSNHSKATDTGILLGYTNAEMLEDFAEHDSPEAWQASFTNGLRIGFNVEESKLNQLSGIVRRFYLGDKKINIEERRDIMMYYLADFKRVYPYIRGIQYFLEGGAENVYQYLFSYEGNRNFVKVKYNITLPGVAHADEIGYLFKMEFIPEEPSAEDQLIIDRVTTMWTSFAKYRDPTPNTTVLLPVKWEPVTKGSPYHYIDIDTKMSTHMRFENRRMSFWELFYKAYGNYERGYLDPNTSETPDPVTDSSIVLSCNPVSCLVILFVNILANW